MPSQHSAMPATSNSGSTSSITRTVRRSLRLAISRVNVALPTPCATSALDSARMSAAQCTSVGMSGARRIADASSRTDRRCSANRSRSDTTPATRPSAAVTITWRMPCCAIASAASPAVAVPGNAIGGALITAPIGVSSGRCGSTMRLDHVLPREDAGRESGGIDDGQRADAPVLHRGQRAPQRLVRGDHDRRDAQQVRERRREAALLGDARRVLGVQLRAQEIEQVREPPRARVAKHVRARDERVELGGRKLEAERVAHRAVDRRHAAMAEQRAQRKHLARREFPQARAVAGSRRAARRARCPASRCSNARAAAPTGAGSSPRARSSAGARCARCGRDRPRPSRRTARGAAAPASGRRGSWARERSSAGIGRRQLGRRYPDGEVGQNSARRARELARPRPVSFNRR